MPSKQLDSRQDIVLCDRYSVDRFADFLVIGGIDIAASVEMRGECREETRLQRMLHRPRAGGLLHSSV